jgi:hypothetical protein
MKNILKVLFIIAISLFLPKVYANQSFFTFEINKEFDNQYTQYTFMNFTTNNQFKNQANFITITSSKEYRDQTNYWDGLTVTAQPNSTQGVTLTFSNQAGGFIDGRAGGTGKRDNILFDGGWGSATQQNRPGAKLKLDNGSFGYSYVESGNKLLVANKVTFELSNSSNLALEQIYSTEQSIPNSTEKAYVTDLSFFIKDSNVLIRRIDLSASSANVANDGNKITEIRIENKEKDNNYKTKIEGNLLTTDQEYIAINLGTQGFIQNDTVIKNGILDIGGSIYARNISGFRLENSSFLFNGMNIAPLRGEIVLQNNSEFMVYKKTGDTFKVTLPIISQRSPRIKAENSKFIWDNIQILMNDAAAFGVSLSASTFKVDNITWDCTSNICRQNNPGIQHLSFEITSNLGSEVDIGTIDLRNDNHWASANGITNSFKITGDGKSKYININTIYLNDPDIEIVLRDNNINIVTLNYEAPTLRLINSKDYTVRIDNINLSPGTQQEGVINLDSFRLRTQNIRFNNTTDIRFNFRNTISYLGNVTCQGGCESVNISGNGTNSTRVVFNSINTNNQGVNNSVSTISGGTYIVENNFNVNGTLSLVNTSLDVGALNGNFNAINLNASSLTLGNSNINLLNNNILDVDSRSVLTINGSNIFRNNTGNIDNSGIVYINAINNINNINNSGSMYISAALNANNITNTGLLSIKGDTNTGTLTSTAGILDIHKNLYVGDMNVTNTNINLHIDSKKDYGQIYVNNIQDLDLTDQTLSIYFNNVTIFKPGRNNRFDLIIAANDEVPDLDLTGTIAFLPPWIRVDCDLEGAKTCKEDILDQNGNQTGGQILFTNVIRLTDYENILNHVPGFNKDKEAMNIARTIDSIVFTEDDVSDNLVDVINSLDFNSSCTAYDVIPEAHNAGYNGVTIDVNKAPCIVNMGENMRKLKPINNSVFVLAFNNNLNNAQDILFDHSKDYYPAKEYNIWFKTATDYNYSENKNFVEGNSRFNQLLQVGASANLAKNINFLVAGGTNLGFMLSNDSNYDVLDFGMHAGVSLVYNDNSNFINLGFVYGANYYDNTRKINFMDNQFSENRNTEATSSLNLQGFNTKLEIGKIFKFSDVQNANDLYITPNAYVSYGKITSSAYEEKGTSAALNVNSASVNVYEVGAGVDVYKEYLLEKFLGQEYGFWTPKASFNIIKKHYSNLETNYYFKDYSQYLIKGNNAGYDDTVVFQTKLGVDFVKNQITLKAITKFDLAPNSYYNASIMTYFKYSL